jgi:hypothetical protein
MQTHRMERRNWSVGKQGLAVLAAGVGLGAAMEAEATIVVTDPDPDIVINAQNPSFAIDLNGDAITDFTLAVSSFQDIPAIALSGPGTSQVIGDKFAVNKPFALAKWDPVGPAGPYVGLSAFLAPLDWNDGTNAYLGLKFDIEGSTHFGWAHVQTNFSDAAGVSATLFAYAYCDQPDTGLGAGHEGACASAVPLPSALALLAVGAGAVLALRRREDTAS